MVKAKEMYWTLYCTLRIIFWKPSKQKNMYFLFQNMYVVHGLSLVKVVHISNIEIIKKVAWFDYTTGAI